LDHDAKTGPEKGAKTDGGTPLSKGPGLVREVWEKLLEYAEAGAAEASRITSIARERVDLETARHRRRGLFKELGKRCYAAWERARAQPLPGTEPLLREIHEVEEEIRELKRLIGESASGDGGERVPGNEEEGGKGA
jgi:hypothetical protein